MRCAWQARQLPRAMRWELRFRQAIKPDSTLRLQVEHRLVVARTSSSVMEGVSSAACIVDCRAMTPAPLDARELLQALDLPPEGVPAFLVHVKAFCLAHGGPAHYAELLALVQKYLAATESA